MKQYRVLKDYTTRTGELILAKGTILNPLNVTNGNAFDLYGVDKRNKFWTNDFLDSKPELFKQQ